MTSVVLIGMPGAGKSTIGVLLAKKLAKDFVDTDLLIQLQAQQPLQDIVNQKGHLALRELEQEVLLRARFRNHVIATGGSAVYSESAMRRLKQEGPLVYLQVALEELVRRIGDFSSRGIACDPGQDFADIYAERCPLYKRYADITIDESGLDAEQIVDAIVVALDERREI